MLTAKKALLHHKKVMKEVINYSKSQQEDAFEKINKCSRTAAIAQVAAHLPTWTRTVIVHVYHVHIVCGYGMLTSYNKSETITNFFYVWVYIYSHN